MICLLSKSSTGRLQYAILYHKARRHQASNQKKQEKFLMIVNLMQFYAFYVLPQMSDYLPLKLKSFLSTDKFEKAF